MCEVEIMGRGSNLINLIDLLIRSAPSLHRVPFPWAISIGLATVGS